WSSDVCSSDLTAMFAHAQTADAVHLEGAHQPLRVVGMNARSGLGVYGGKLSMQFGQALFGGLTLEFGAHQRVGAGHVGETAQQCLVIKHRAAEDRKST